MDRFYIPVQPDNDFPEVIVAQKMGEDFEKEYVEYEPRWRLDRQRRAVVVDEKFFYAMADTAERLSVENARLRELAVLNWEWAHSCCGNNCKMQMDGCGYGIDRECNYEREIYDLMRELGIEVDE